MEAYFKHLFFFLFLSLLFSCEQITETKTELPNIILISMDDMGYSDLGCYGSEINTPNIDGLAENGMRFKSFYNTAKCFPSRAALMTGVYAQDCGYHQTFKNPIENAVTIGEVLKTKSYQTYWVGKHHGIENPVDRGFDNYYGLLDGACNHFNPGEQREGEPKPAQKRNNRKWVVDGKLHQPYTPLKDFYTTDAFTNYAVKYLNESKQKEDPFFLYLAYTAPHDPLMAWPKDIAKYEGKYDDGYEIIRQKRFEKQKKIGLLDQDYPLSDPEYDEWAEMTSEERQEEANKMEVYAAMIDRVDQNIGRLLATLKSLDYTDNTIIFLVSDNGASREMVVLEDDNDKAPVGRLDRWVSLGQSWANVSNTPFRYYKTDSYEGGINTPMIAYWPQKIAAKSFSDFPGHIMDFMATILDVTNADYPSEHNGSTVSAQRGTSLLPAFDNESIERSEPLYWEWNNGQAMRQGNWKIVREKNSMPWELYDLGSDPIESIDLGTERPALVASMDSSYQLWYRKYY